MIQTFQTQSDDEMASVYTSKRVESGVSPFYSGSFTQVPLRYLYRGGLEQTGAYSTLTALEREKKNTKPIKQWSTVFDVSRLLIEKLGYAVCKLNR